MGKQALRWLLGAGYVVLVTLLLLYQMGAVGKMRNSVIAALGTLLLGAALAVVLVLYIRLTDQIKDSGKAGQDAQTDVSMSAEEKQDAAEKADEQGYEQEARGYEEIYGSFLKVSQGYDLSERELEVAWLLYRGYTNRQIGEELYIAETTVKKHVSHIYQKMEVYSRKDFRAKVQRESRGLSQE